MMINKKLAIARNQLDRVEKELVTLKSVKKPYSKYHIHEIDKKQHEIGNIKFIIRLYEDLLK